MSRRNQADHRVGRVSADAAYVTLGPVISHADSLRHTRHAPVVGDDLPAEHRALLEAALVRDADRVANLLRGHFIATMELVLEQSCAASNIASALTLKGQAGTRRLATS